MARELSKHANIILSSGAYYEDLLWARFRVKGTGLNDRINRAAYLIPQNLAIQLRQFARMRNECAHKYGYVVLDKPSDAVNLINQIEKGFASLLDDYKPDLVSEGTFQQPPPTGKTLYVYVPKPRTIYFQEVLVPRLIKAGVAAAIVALIGVIGIIGMQPKRGGSNYSNYDSNVLSGISSHNNGSVAVFVLMGIGIIVFVVGWFTNVAFKKWRAKRKMARLRSKSRKLDDGPPPA